MPRAKVADAAALGHARSVFDSIRRIVRVLRLSARDAEKSFGVSAAQLFVLHKLAEAPSLTPSELAARTLTDLSSISVVVSRLVTRRLVKRARSASDGRSFVLSLTPAGRAVVKKTPDVTQQRLLAGLLAMPAGDVRDLAGLLEKLVGATGLAGEAATMLLEEDADVGRRSKR